MSIKEDAPLQHYATYFDDDGYKFEFKVVGLNDKKEKKIQIAKDDKFPITLSKMMLSSDYLKSRYYYERPIYIFGEPRTVELQYSAKKQKNEDKMENSFTTIDFKELEIIPTAKITSNNANATIQQDDTIPGRFNLSEMNQSKSSNSKEAELKITFPGASGKNLEVNRSVVYLPYTKNTEKWSKLTNGQKVSYHHLKEQHKIELFIANPNQEELTVGLTKHKDNEPFVIKEQVYSADGSMMKVSVEYEPIKNNEKLKLKYEVSYNNEKGKTGHSDKYKVYIKKKQLNESARYTFEDKTESVANSASHQLTSDKKDFERKVITDSSTKKNSETDKIDSSSSDSSLPLEEKDKRKEVSVQEEQSVKEEQNKITDQNQADSETSLEHVTAHLQEIEED